MIAAERSIVVSRERPSAASLRGQAAACLGLFFAIALLGLEPARAAVGDNAAVVPEPALAALLRSPTRCVKPGTGGEVVVCGGRNREAERQRLPFPPPADDGDPRQFSVSRERNALVEDRSGVGALRCDSASGADAGSGCLARDMERYHEQHPGGFVPRLPVRVPDDEPVEE